MNKKILKYLKLFLLVFLFISPYKLNADDKGYELEEVVVLSRHNIRSPLSTKGSILDSATPHEWYNWSSNASELSLQGGMLETAMGQYFRKWLEKEGLIEENYRGENEEVRFYANAKQRTIATSNYFIGGFLPVNDLDVVTKADYDTMDPVFNPVLTFVNDKYREDASKTILAAIPDLSKEYELLMDVLDFKDSDDYKSGSQSEFKNGDDEAVVEVNKEPGLKGSLKNATSLADALVLQYYEEEDDLKAAFGHELTLEDWQAISRIKDVYGDVLFADKLISTNVAHPLLQEIRSELKNKDRKFGFLCGHDSNIVSVLSALDVEEYKLEDAIEAKTPIGCKFVIEKLKKNNEEFVRLSLCYNSIDQLRHLSLLSDENPPKFCQLKIKGLQANEDGLYRLDDFMKQLDKAIDAYDEMIRKYEPSSAQLPKTGID